MWRSQPTDDGCHVVPVNDIVEHELSEDCECGPEVLYINPDTGVPFSSGGRLVTHNAADQREKDEPDYQP